MRIIALALLFCVSTSAQILDTLPLKTSRDRATYRSMVTRIANLRLTVDWKDENLYRVVRSLRMQLGLNFVIDPALKETAEEASVTLSLKEVSGRAVLRLLESSQKIAFQNRGGILYVTSPEEALKKAMVLRTYSVKDMLYTPPDFPGPRLGIKVGPVEEQREEPEPPEQKDPAFLEDLLRQSTGADVWEVEGSSITIHNGTLIVRHAPKVQAKVRSLLARLRGVF